MKNKRNFWPVGIVLGVALCVAGNAAFVIIACSNKTELVSRDYYDQEIRFQARIDSRTRTAQMATRASVSYNEAAKNVVVTLPAEHVGKAESGEVVLYCPSSAGEDRSYKLAPDANGVQALDVANLSQGLYRVHFAWKVAGEEYFFDQKIAIGPASLQARLAEFNKRTEALRN